MVKNKLIINPADSLLDCHCKAFDRFLDISDKNIVVLNGNFNNLEMIDEEKEDLLNSEDYIVFCNGGYPNSKSLIGTNNPLKIKSKTVKIAKGKKEKELSIKLLNYIGYGHPIYDMNDNVVAEITSLGNVFFLTDVFSTKDESLIEYIVDEASLFLHGKSITGKKKNNSDIRSFYEKITLDKLKKTNEEIAKKIEDMSAEIEVVQETLIKANRSRELLLFEVSKNENLIETIDERIKKDIDNLKKINGYKLFRIIQEDESGKVVQKIFGITNEVYIEKNGKKYKLGKFKVELNINTAQIRVYNVAETLCTQDSKHQHPCVLNNQVCLGNILSCITEYVASYEFSAVFELIINLLSNDSSHPYLSVDIGWPEVEQ